MLEQRHGEYMLNNYKVHIILFPLAFHKYAKPMTYYILAGKDNKEKFNRFVKTMEGDNTWQEFNKKLSKKEKEKLDKQIEYNQKICLKLGVRGTPTILNDKFQEINPNTLNQK